jgi:hypothetical protein
MIYQTKVDKLTINNTKGDYQSHVYVAPADRQGTTGLGQIFLLAEARSREKKIPSMLEQVVQELSEYYYHSPTKNTEAALETTAQYFNENIVDISGKNIKWVREKMGMMVAAITDNKLIISNFGDIRVWLLRDNKIHDITAGQVGGKRKGTSKKILSQLISGQLTNDDVLLMTNSTIFDYFSDDKIKKTVMTLAPTQACAFFKNTLLDYKVPVDFSTVIIKFSEFKKEPQKIDDVSHSDVLEVDDEVEKLNQAEPKMGSKIALAIGGSIKKGATKSSQMIKDRMKKKEVASSEEDLEEEDKFETPEDSERADMPVSDRWLKFKKWKNFNIVEYRLVLLILIVAVLFVGSLAIVNRNNESEKNTEQFDLVAADINDKINSAEAALIYKDEDRAQELLSEARALLDSLSGETPDQEYVHQELKEKVEAQINKIYKLEPIENLEVLANLPDGLNPTSNIYVSTGNIIYLAKGGEIYKVNSSNQSVDKVSDVDANVIKIVDFEKGKVLLWTSNMQTWIMDTSNYSVRKVGLSSLRESSQVVDIATYAKKLYVLDIGENNIYKYNYSTTNFTSAGAWLSNGEDLSGNRQISVDGSVFVAAANGEVSKFFKGKQEVFSVKGAFDQMSENTSLFTKEELSNLYLLDRDKNRILITDKTGKVGRQLLGDGLDQILSVIPNNNEQELYILTSSKVYKLSI